MIYEFDTLGIVFTAVMALLALFYIDGVVLFAVSRKKRGVRTILYRIFAYVTLILSLGVAALYVCYKFELLSIRDVHQLMTLSFTGKQLFDFPREYITELFDIFDTLLARAIVIAAVLLDFVSIILSHTRRYKGIFEADQVAATVKAGGEEEIAGETAEEAPAEEASEEEIVEAVPVEEPAEEAEDTPVEEVPVEEAPVEEAPIEEVAAKEDAIEETPVEEVAAEETPAVEPAEESPAEEIVEEVPVEEAPVEEVPAEEVAIEEDAVEEDIAKEDTIDEIPAEEASAKENAIEETPVEEVPVEKVAVEKSPAEEETAPVAEPQAEEPAHKADEARPSAEPRQQREKIGQTSPRKIVSAVQMPNRSGFHPSSEAKERKEETNRTAPVRPAASAASAPAEGKNSVPVTRRMVIANRMNVVNVFNDYLNEKSQEERDKLSSSITKITLK